MKRTKLNQIKLRRIDALRFVIFEAEMVHAKGGTCVRPSAFIRFRRDRPDAKVGKLKNPNESWKIQVNPTKSDQKIMEQQSNEGTKVRMAEMRGGYNPPDTTKMDLFVGLAGVNGCIRRGKTVGVVAVQLARGLGVW